MDLQEAIKRSIQSYFDGQDVVDKNSKFTKSYFDTFHDNVLNPKEASQSKKKVKEELANAQDIPNK